MERNVCKRQSMSFLNVGWAMGQSITLGNLRRSFKLWLGACGAGFSLLEELLYCSSCLG